MSMYFFDETDDWPEYQTIREEIHRLEKEHLEVQVTDMCSSRRGYLLFKKVRLTYCLEGLSAKRPGDCHVHVFLR